VLPGLFFDGGKGKLAYALLDDWRYNADRSPATFHLTPGFNATVSFRSSSTDAILLTAWQSTNCFALISLHSGQVCSCYAACH
jgi:hypothetical protein